MIVRPLTEYCTLNMGQSPDSKTYNTQGKGLPFYQGNADFGETHPITHVWCSAPVKVAEDGDILISVRAPIGAMNMAVERCCIGRGLAALTPIRNKCSKQFLYYALQSKVDSLIAQGTGSTFKAISKKVLEATCIPAYSTIEQVQIAEIIGRVDNTIAARRNQLVLLDQLVKSRFIELFGDPIKNTQHRPTTAFVNVVTMQRGFDLPVQDREQSGNIPVYGSNGVLDHHNQSKACNGGVITGRSGTIGKVFYTRGAYWPLNTTLFSVDTHENNIIYLAHLLRMFNLARFTEGTGVPTLNRNKFHSAPIIDVPIDEQNQFAAFVEQTDKSKLAVQKGLQELEILKKSLMQQYFG